MNKSNVRHKRSLGKDSPLSKRPKLDFTLKPKVPLKDSKHNSKGSPKNSSAGVKEKGSSVSLKKNIQEDTSTSSDWDDDFSGDMLEKVCLIADLSQAMVNNQPVTRDLNKEQMNFEVLESKKVTVKSKSSCLPSQDPESEYENLKLELERLQEKLKTKEGEVHILRSQLKQSEDAKQAVALQNIKVLEDVQKKFNEKISLTEKELESTKSKLLFRDLEYKTLSERCRQLEYNITKSKIETNSKSFTMSQLVYQNSFVKEANDSNQMLVTDNCKGGTAIDLDFPTEFHHEGKLLAEIICPEFFKFTHETNIVTIYNFHNEMNNQRSSLLDRKEKYKFSNLPRQTVFIKELYDSVSTLFTYSDFTHNEAQKTVQTIVDSCVEILTHLKQVLVCLEELQLCSDYDEADQFLLQNEEEVKLITIKNLIDGKKHSKEECGIEGRRSLALIYALMKSSQCAFNVVKNNPNFMELVKNLAAAIGTLRRPLRYNGILIGISFILQKILEEDKLTKEHLKLINGTVEEIIFSRPKLDALIEVVNVLASGKHHLNFLMSLCRNDPVDSCTLYMDCKLKQAMFFTKNTCPLKLLCMQIMGLACLPSSRPLRWEITSCIITWLNSSINTPYYKKIKWLPISSLPRQERCFDVTECLLYLLTLCLKDYLEICSQESVTSEKGDVEKKKVNWISIIAEGSVLVKRILKAEQKHLNDNNYSTRFAMLLKGLLKSKSDLCQKSHLSCLSSLQVEAITWITDLLESDLKNQDCCLKQNTSALSDIDFFNSLKIIDDPKIN